MKKIFWFVIFVLAIFILAVPAFFFYEKENQMNEEKQKQQDSLLQDSFSTESISQKDNFYNIQAEYPQFKGVSPDFNRKISELLLGQIDTFKKNAKGNWEARRATATPENPVPENPDIPFDFIASWHQTQTNERYISFTLEIYNFIGGAHGTTQIYAFNFDIKNNKEVAISEFLKSPSMLQSLAELCKKEVTLQLEGSGINIDENLKQMIDDGTKPTLENYADFNFTDDSLIIYFQQYQVAPGYIGPVTVTLNKDSLSENSITSDYLN